MFGWLFSAPSAGIEAIHIFPCGDAVRWVCKVCLAPVRKHGKPLTDHVVSAAAVEAACTLTWFSTATIAESERSTQGKVRYLR